MKKEEFLTKLQKNLSVLEEKEVQDIIEEYEQHIDMKMQGGLSEEAAIADFGDLRELTAGILEAYHVKADYQSEKKNLDFEKVKEESKKATEKATNAIGKGADAIGKGIGKGVGACGKGIGAAGRWCAKQMKKMWAMMKKPFANWKEKAKERKENSNNKSLFAKLWTMIVNICTFCWSCVLWVIGFVWDCFWILLALFFGIGAVICIFLLGVSVVLLISGYPLIGITIAIVGGCVVCMALALLAFMLLHKRPQEVKTHA